MNAVMVVVESATVGNFTVLVRNDIHVMSEGNSVTGGVIRDWEGLGKATVDAVMVVVESATVCYFLMNGNDIHVMSKGSRDIGR